ncbi:hypothetical protein RHGRI_008430 [Rhododendron griersonianum]|uniref:Uncharacterized protein n=1 Tax=Rhododendron griersonianum TaxID=479676 RepID=A0AAV6L0U5_9ERIC|nr:hypothetical protein RHGRI_008430 [Rhododendron griersonianum]
MAGSALSRSHRMVSPSDLWPSSRVNWKILAAQAAGIRILRPLPSTLVCRSFDDALLGPITAIGCGCVCVIGITPTGIDPSRSESVCSSFKMGTMAPCGGGSPSKRSDDKSCFVFPSSSLLIPSSSSGSIIRVSIESMYVN